MIFLSKLILKLLGWKIVGPSPHLKKFVICAAPHTSNWDFIVGRLQCVVFDLQPITLIKAESFFFPLGIFLKAINAYPVKRGSKNNIIDILKKEFDKNEKFTVIITPEGTRKKRKRWKRGFYHIAVKANVPILLAYSDYKKKEIGMSNFFYPTGDVEKDIITIKKFYQNIGAKHPEKFITGLEKN